MMPDREKVINELNDCLENQHIEFMDGVGDIYAVSEETIRNVIALLKEQEARVITREELQQFEGSPCWFESSGTYMGKDGFWIIPAVFRTFFGGIIMSYTSVLNGAGDYGELGLSAYNKTWRCWTTKPTTEQRQAVKWE